MFNKTKEKKVRLNIKSDKKNFKGKNQKKGKKIKFGIGFKIGRGFVILIVLMTIGMAGFYLLLDTISEENIQVREASLLEEKAHKILSIQKEYVITANEKYVQEIRTLVGELEKEIENFRALSEDKNEELDRAQKYLEEYLIAINQ